MRFASIAWVVCSVAVSTGCGGESSPGSGASAAGGGKPVIVATIYPLADVARQIAGDAADVVCLVPPGISPHGFEPTTVQAEGLTKASMLIRVGMGFDDWVLAAHKRHGRPEALVIAMSGEKPDAHADDKHDHNHDHAHDHDHLHAGPNPHIWLDPVRMAKFAHHLGHELMERIPAHADAIHDRAEALEADIEAIDAEYRAALAAIPDKRIVTFHDAFNVMAERYGIEVAATLMPIDPSGSLTRDRIEKAIAAIRLHKISVVYTEPQFPAEAGDVLRNEAGVRVLTLDEQGDPNVPDRATYQKTMRFNLRSLMDGFKPTQP